MDTTFVDKASEQSSTTQKRKSGFGETHRHSTLRQQDNYSGFADPKEKLENISGEDIQEQVMKKTKVSRELFQSSNGDTSLPTTASVECSPFIQKDSSAGSLPDSASILQLSIIPTIEPNSPPAQLEGYAKQLFLYLFQIAKAGKMIDTVKREMDTKQQHKTNIHVALLKDIPDLKLRKFVVFACNTVLNADKLTPHRFIGPSFRRICRYYPDSDSCKVDLQNFLWHLLIWRLFGFSKLDVIDKLYHTRTVEEGLGVLSEVDKFLEKPLTVIGAYGNFRIPVEKRQVVLEGLHNLSQALSLRLISNHMRFNEALETIGTCNVLFLPQDGLLAWLVGCDLTEWNLCAPPTVEDLADKIGVPPFTKGKKARGGAGTRGALFVVQETCKLDFPFKTSTDLQIMLTQVLDALNYTVGDECRELQNRELSMADMEHMLCKISRLSKF